MGIHWRLYKSGLLDSEYTDVVPIWFGCLGQTGMHFAKPIRSNDNLGGLKLRVAGKVPSQLVEKVGGTPVSMAAENMYKSLQRGTIDGAVTSWSAFEPYKLIEVSFYHLEVPVGSTPSMFAMSKKRFDALPEAARKALIDNGGEAQTRAFGTSHRRPRRAQPAASGNVRQAQNRAARCGAAEGVGGEGRDYPQRVGQGAARRRQGHRGFPIALYAGESQPLRKDEAWRPQPIAGAC